MRFLIRDNKSVKEALHNDEITKHKELTRDLGIKTLGDLKSFKDHQGSAELDALKDYKKELDLDEALGLKEGISGNMTIEEIAEKHKVPVEDIRKQLEIGVKVEKEHTDDKSKAERIALDHLFEIPNYYDKLDKMEKSALKEETEKEIRFIPVDRYAVDGRRWYVVYDKQENNYASFPAFFGKYTTRKDCQYAIDKFVEENPDYKYIDESLKEDTIKQNGKWVNKGKEETLPESKRLEEDAKNIEIRYDVVLVYVDTYKGENSYSYYDVFNNSRYVGDKKYFTNKESAIKQADRLYDENKDNEGQELNYVVRELKVKPMIRVADKELDSKIIYNANKNSKLQLIEDTIKTKDGK